MKDKKSGGAAYSFIGNLTIAFIALKLAGFISWSWVWVIAPIWIPLAVALIFLSIGAAIDKYQEGQVGKKE